jgi:hypothetical protein
MPMTAEPPEVAPLQASEIEAGVIKEARRRQRRRRRAGMAFGGGVLVISTLALLIAGGGGSHPGASGPRSPETPLKLTLVHGRPFAGGQPALMGVTMSLQAGNVGVCVMVAGDGSCNGPLPSRAYPVYGGGGDFSPEEKVGPEGEIDAIFTSSRVASMRVAHLGSFKAERGPGLPPGARQIVFYRPPGSPGTVLPPGSSPQRLQSFERGRRGPALTETLLDASGHVIPVDQGQSTFTLPNSYWQGTQAPPADGRCMMRSSLPGVRTEWGQVATEIAPDHDLDVPGWLTCLHTWFSRQGASYETAVLLNASSPGRPPAMLWGAVPLPGHPGMVVIPAVQREIRFRLPPLPSRAQQARDLAQLTKQYGRTRALQDRRRSAQLAGTEQSFWQVLRPEAVARRVGPAWVLVRGGNTPAERVRFLEGLRLTKLMLTDSR